MRLWSFNAWIYRFGLKSWVKKLSVIFTGLLPFDAVPLAHDLALELTYFLLGVLALIPKILHTWPCPIYEVILTPWHPNLDSTHPVVIVLLGAKVRYRKGWPLTHLSFIAWKGPVELADRGNGSVVVAEHVVDLFVLVLNLLRVVDEAAIRIFGL